MHVADHVQITWLFAVSATCLYVHIWHKRLTRLPFMMVAIIPGVGVGSGSIRSYTQQDCIDKKPQNNVQQASYPPLIWMTNDYRQAAPIWTWMLSWISTISDTLRHLHRIYLGLHSTVNTTMLFNKIWVSGLYVPILRTKSMYVPLTKTNWVVLGQ